MLVKRMSAQEARINFSDLLGAVYYAKETVIVEKRGRAFAVVISPEEYDRLIKERQARFAILDAIRAKNPDVTPEEAEEDAVQETASARETKALREQRAAESE